MHRVLVGDLVAATGDVWSQATAQDHQPAGETEGLNNIMAAGQWLMQYLGYPGSQLYSW